MEGARFYLTVLQILLDYERQVLPFDPLMDFQFLTPEEYTPCDCGREYAKLLECYRKEYVYELMRLGLEVTPFKTLGHIAGVHYIAMAVARGLKQAGVDIDLALISGSAAAHDIGKFGCRPGERVPHLHYYYTDQWLLERHLDNISHIASNHSTWDLELESLSVESLCLIYADFRSKQSRDADGNEITVLYPLDESFQVILSKLENVEFDIKCATCSENAKGEQPAAPEKITLTRKEGADNSIRLLTGVEFPMSFTDKGNGHKVTVDADETFTNGVLWQQDAESFVCMEPWNGWANSVNEEGKHEVLEPDEAMTSEWSITIEKV